MSTAPSDFYERKRRLSIAFAGLSAVLLFATLFLGFFLEVYSRPLAAVDGERLLVAHRSQAVDADTEPGTRLTPLDSTLRPSAPPLRLLDSAGALLAEDGETSLFFGTRVSVLRDGRSLRSADLGQKWDVRAAAPDPARRGAWIFGERDGALVARRRALGTWSEELPVSPAGAAERMTAFMDGTDGPWVAWRETGASKIRSARFDGRGFVPGPVFEGEDADHWDLVPWQGRLLLATYRKEERTWRQVVLRLSCCPGCDSPLEPRRLAFADPVMVLGRRVTGLAAVRFEGRLVFILGRWTTVQAASVAEGTWTPEAPARLVPVGGEPLWRILGAASIPVLLLFFSFSMIFLGVTLLHERGKRPLLETLAPAASVGPVPGEVLQRAMAYILDHIVLLPFFVVAVEMLSVSPEVSSLDPADPKLLGMLGVWLGLHFLYHFGCEWLLGWTPGKRIIGLRVANEDGTRVGFRGALVRNLLRPLDAEYPAGVFLGAILMMTSGRRQRLGDRWGRTMVIQDSRPPTPAKGV